MNLRLCLFEDAAVAQLEPLTATRPAFELVCGATTLAAKQHRHFVSPSAGALVRPYLADLCRLRRPGMPVNDPDWLQAGPAVLVNARWLPPLLPAPACDRPCVATVGETVAYAVVGPELLAGCSVENLAECLDHWKKSLPHRPAGGTLIHYPWDLVENNPAQLCRDFDRAAYAAPPAPLPVGVAVVGRLDWLLLDPTARIEPMVVVDTTNGPVFIGREAVVTAFTRLEGPCYVGPKVHVLGAKVRAGTTLGRGCRVGGEVESSILHGHSNKYHDGFLGHSYVGEWVNLGAGTHNSDLRNDYGPVTVVLGGRPVATGLSKVGCFVGDHTKTGLGTLINTGSNIGSFCHLLPSGRLMPKYMPPFTTYWNGGLREANDVSALIRTAAEVMKRRGATFTEAHAALARDVFEETLEERRRALGEAELRQLHRSA
ncbi:MAG: hypothetical protein L0Z62_12705 [Gemmataceae bacterium]|nr:hypothetical protein [Gemmataceae bacterium]